MSRRACCWGRLSARGRAGTARLSAIDPGKLTAEQMDESLAVRQSITDWLLPNFRTPLPDRWVGVQPRTDEMAARADADLGLCLCKPTTAWALGIMTWASSVRTQPGVRRHARDDLGHLGPRAIVVGPAGTEGADQPDGPNLLVVPRDWSGPPLAPAFYTIEGPRDVAEFVTDFRSPDGSVTRRGYDLWCDKRGQLRLELMVEETSAPDTFAKLPRVMADG